MLRERGAGLGGASRPRPLSAARSVALLALAVCFSGAALVFLRPQASEAPSVAPPGASNMPAAAVQLSVPAASVQVGEPQVLSGTGWRPGAPVTIATVNESGTVARYARTMADERGAFSHPVVVPEPGVWTHRAYWQPDASLPPREGDRLATLQVRAVLPDRS